MKLTLGFSPCPNDTFIFDALVNHRIDTGELEFEVILEDVETLNAGALQGKLDITKLSFPAFFQSIDTYVLLNSGSALGKGVGPLLVSKSPIGNWQSSNGKEQLAMDNLQSKIENSKVALPGINTTANLLFSFAFPGAKKKEFMIFSAIEDAVLMEKADLGVIIHENRFTYRDKGLHKVADLGSYWEERMKVPIPLGGIAARRSLGETVIRQVDQLIRKSIETAYKTYPVISDYVKSYSQSMSEDVMRQHIDLYVNDFSLDLGKDGKQAVIILHEVYQEINPGKNSLSSSGLFQL
jgi:1,4-dihydroxy-6-naphthoate synthase